jgi:hypothetical protein
MDILKSVSFGRKYFQMAITLREAELVNGMLTNADVWYGLSQAEVDELEEVDKLLLRRVFEAPSSSCIESLYLELGLTPIRVIIKARRINYLHYLLNLKENEMLYSVFKAQWKYPTKDDWTVQVQKDLQDLKIDMSLEEMKKKSQWSFKRLVKIKSKEYTLDYLLDLKEQHRKMDSLEYTELKLQEYLKDDEIPVVEARNLYRFRTRVAKFKLNFKNSYESIACPLCLVQPDTQVHCVQCPEVKNKIDVQGDYRDIFTERISTDISRTLLKITNLRENLL